MIKTTVRLVKIIAEVLRCHCGLSKDFNIFSSQKRNSAVFNKLRFFVAVYNSGIAFLYFNLRSAAVSLRYALHRQNKLFFHFLARFCPESSYNTRQHRTFRYYINGGSAFKGADA